MNRNTGLGIADESDHIRQSIADILTTPIGSRLIRREYGSLLPDLIDHPSHQATRMRLMAATVMAIQRWEPRVAISSVVLAGDMDGAFSIELSTTRRTGPRVGQPLSIVHLIK